MIVERPRDGFTILEIMIATAILTLGLVGILALFPVAIHTGKQIVEKSTAVVIAESVAEAIREGMRNQLRYSLKPPGDAYFIFKHDGVMDPIPLMQEKDSPKKDYYILLPTYSRTTAFSGRTARRKALASARTFLYPETDRLMNGNSRARNADNDGNDYTYTFTSSKESYTDVLVEKTYSLGNLLPASDARPDEYVLSDQQIESLKQYSYAFTLSPSIHDANRSPNPDQYQPAGLLFHVRIMIFRSFVPPVEGAEPTAPVFELDFEVSR